MVGDNKILTVSYGTFSCTLEGFDEPFNTMTAIAEYFRDLAAGDRFFGAEPPQPDTEMLHKIAEQTIQARVDASVSENSMILRQAEAAPAMDPLAIAGLAGGAAAVAPAAEVELEDAAPEQAQDDVQEVLTPEPSNDFGGCDTVAEKLQRIRAVVDHEAVVVAPYSEDQHADERGDVDMATTEHPMFSEADDTLEADEADYEDEVEPIEASLEDSDEAMIEDIVEPTPDLSVEAEVEAADAEADVQDSEEDHAEEVALVAKDADESFDADDADAVGDDFEASLTEALAEDNDADAGDDTDQALSNLVSTLNPDDAIAEDDYEDDGTETDAASDAIMAVLSGETDAETENVDMDAVESQEERVADVDYDGDLDDEPEDLIAPSHDIMVEEVSLEEVEAASADMKDVFADAEDDLSPEQEEDLRRELEAVEAEAVDDIEDVTSEAEAETDYDDFVMPGAPEDGSSDNIADLMAGAAKDQAEEARAARLARRAVPTEDEDAALERLMSTTSSRLENDESSVRRASIAHLKAAVAATKADNTMAEEAEAKEERELGQYREDLARVVRPGRPSSSSAKTSRPSPLVLVSEQRIDEPEAEVQAEEAAPAAAAVDVRPRRVTGNLAVQTDEAEDADQNPSDDQSFMEYATAANALELPEMLEAAAAHYTFVENTPHFTRPMLMRKIASISSEKGFSREDGLRSFGTLLREAKIVKHEDGKFVIAKNSRFASEARYAGE